MHTNHPASPYVTQEHNRKIVCVLLKHDSLANHTDAEASYFKEA